VSGIRRLVLDVLKPHQPSNIIVANRISDIPNIEGINIALNEIDQNTETLKITIEGVDMDFDKIKETLEELGAVIHSIDQIVAGKKIVESVETEQD